MKTFKEVISEAAVDPALSKIKSEIEQFFRKTRGVTIQHEDPKHFHNPKAVLAIGARYWGKWNMPDGENDDEDYDWEELDSTSHSLLKGFLTQLETKYKKYSMSFGAEEKNWIFVTVAKK